MSEGQRLDGGRPPPIGLYAGGGCAAPLQSRRRGACRLRPFGSRSLPWPTGAGSPVIGSCRFSGASGGWPSAGAGRRVRRRWTHPRIPTRLAAAGWPRRSG